MIQGRIFSYSRIFQSPNISGLGTNFSLSYKAISSNARKDCQSIQAQEKAKIQEQQNLPYSFPSLSLRHNCLWQPERLKIQSSTLKKTIKPIFRLKKL